MGVVPVGAHLVGDEAVGELAADRDGVLGDPGDAVHRVGHVDPVPVQGDAVGRRTRWSACTSTSWPWVAVIVGPGEVPLSVKPGMDWPPTSAFSLPGDQIDPDVGLARRVGDQVVDAEPAAGCRWSWSQPWPGPPP